MHEHDLDLIAAYADGTSSPTEAEVAARAVAACATCAAEHALHVEVLEIMESASPVSMSDIERASLHRQLQVALPVPKVGRFTRYVPRVAAVAAGFAVVGLASVAMLSSGEFNDEAATFTTISAALDGSTETANAEMGSLQEAPEDEGLRQSVGYATDDAVPPAADVAEMATEATTFAEEPATLPEITTADLEEMTTSPIDDLVGLYGERSEDDIPVCVEQIADPEAVLVSFDALFEGDLASVFVYREDGTLAAVALSIETCEVLMEVVPDS